MSDHGLSEAGRAHLIFTGCRAMMKKTGKTAEDFRMKSKILVLLAFLLAGLAPSFLSGASQTRKPAWAGQFYDSDPARLEAQIDAFLRSGSKPASNRRPLAIIAPHAGYIYSGEVAGQAYATAAGIDYETVIIIAPAHHVGFEGCSVDDFDFLETPLGAAAVDKDVVRILQKEPMFGFIPKAHAAEHALEVQVPFIQRTLPRAKIVPIIMGTQDGATARSLAEVLVRISKSKKILVVASTDMSHFLSRQKANVLDAATIALVKSQSTGPLLRKIERDENILCGGGGVLSVLLYAQKKGPIEVDVLRYADSSGAGAPDTSVVGYFAAALYLRSGSEPPFGLSPDEKRELLRIARLAVEQAVETNTLLEYTTDNENLLAPKGAFVTLTNNRTLRGCIGFIDPVYPLGQAIIHASYFAALEDRRFNPVSKAELKDLEVEISVLSPLTRIIDYRLVQVGKHGLVIAQGERKGLLLPQVAVDNGWTRDEFLEEACLKAGLGPDSWKRGAEIYTFEAIVFR